MKALILDGSRKDESTCQKVREIIINELSCKSWQVETLALCDLDIRHCLGCFGCWIKSPGECVIQDAGRDVARAFIQSDLVVFLTPVTFGGYSAQLKKVVDRIACPMLLPFFTRINGEVHHKPRYKRYPRLVAVGTLPQADAESERIFGKLVSRNAINLHIPAHAAGVVFDSQGLDAARERIQALFQAVEV